MAVLRSPETEAPVDLGRRDDAVELSRTAGGPGRWKRRGIGIAATPQALGLMAMRGMTIAAKFGLTLFIARYLGLAQLGVYGIIASAAVLCPVLFGFGVSNNLGREAGRNGTSTITPALLQYFAFLVPFYIGLCLLATVIAPDRKPIILAVSLLLFLEQIQTDLFAIMMITFRPYSANLLNFLRSAAWVIVYVPLALAVPALRTLEAVVLAWLIGCIGATLLCPFFTSDWRWASAAAALPRARLVFPHQHGSIALYLNDVANTGFQYIDRYVVGIFLSPTLLGAYVLFSSITNALNNLVTTAIVQTRKGELIKVALAPRVSFNGRLRVVALLTSATTLGLSGVAIVVMQAVAPHIGQPELVRYLPLLFVLCAGLVVRSVYEVLGIAFYAYGRDDITLWSGASILVAGLLLNLALDPVLELWGAASAVLISYTVGVLVRWWLISRGFQTGTLTALKPQGQE